VDGNERSTGALQQLAATSLARAPCGVTLMDLEARCLWSNQAFAAMLGYGAQEIVGKTVSDLTFREDLPQQEELHRQGLSGQLDGWDYIKRFVSRDGALVWAHMRTWVVRDDDGRPLHLASLVTDVSGRDAALHAAIHTLVGAACGGVAVARLPRWRQLSAGQLGSGVDALATAPLRDADPDGSSQDGGDGYTLSLREVAQMLATSTSTVRRWTDDGRLPTRRTAGGHRRFRPTDVERLRDARHVDSDLRSPAFPPQALPFVATVLRDSGLAIARSAVKGLYAGRPGWFAQPAAGTTLRDLVAGLALAYASGDYRHAETAVRRCVREAQRNGASLAERYEFVQLFDLALRRCLHARGCLREEQIGAARAAAAICHQLLVDAERPA
jgi:PAS domain S-box-containing protein/excisionase family DNA binding protein